MWPVCFVFWEHIRKSGTLHLCPVIPSKSVFPLALLRFWRSPSLLLSFKWATEMCWYYSFDGARRPVDVWCLYYTLQWHTISATREPNALLPFSTPCNIASSYIVLSHLSLQQSITMMPGERRSCRCRLETQCTYLRHMKVRAGLLMTGMIGADTPMSDIIFLSSLAPLLFCQIFVHVSKMIY